MDIVNTVLEGYPKSKKEFLVGRILVIISTYYVTIGRGWS